ncbi:MAG TPA: sialidase family protein [Mycobacteriales bacterium]|nr:sialidase family protein [Mycobacteriales bacterium]
MQGNRRLALIPAVLVLIGSVVGVARAGNPSNLIAAGDQHFRWQVSYLPYTTSYGEPTVMFGRGETAVDTFGPTVWTSMNEGRSWVYDEHIDIAGCPSGDADHIILADGTILADNLCYAAFSNQIYRSTDHGRTWHPAGPAMALPAEAGVDVDRQWFSADPSNAKIVYMTFHDLEGPNIWVYKSTDGGTTFTQRVPITVFATTKYPDIASGNTTSRMVVDPQDHNTLYLFYAYSDAVSGFTASPQDPDFLLRRIGLATSHDGGLTWTHQVIYNGDAVKARVGHPFTTAAIDPSGNLYVAYSVRFEPSMATQVDIVRSTNGGRTWSAPIRVSDPRNGSNVMPSIVAPRTGVVDVAYYSTRVGDFDSKQGFWSVQLAQTRDATAAHPRFTLSRVYADNHERDICLAGLFCAITGGDRNLADYLGLTVDARGMALVVWTEDVNTHGSTMFARQTVA